MIKDTCGTVIPDSIIEFWFTRELVSSYEHRAEKKLNLLFLNRYRIHIYLILSIIRSEFYDIILCCYNICKFILIQYSSQSTKRFSSFLADLSRDSKMTTS